MLNFPHSSDSHKKLCSLYFQIVNKLKPLLIVADSLLTVTDSLSDHRWFTLSPLLILTLTIAKPSLTVVNTASPSPFLALPLPIHLASPLLIHFARFNSWWFSLPVVCDGSACWPFATVQLIDRSRCFSRLPTVRDDSVLRTIYDASGDASVLRAICFFCFYFLFFTFWVNFLVNFCLMILVPLGIFV